MNSRMLQETSCTASSAGFKKKYRTSPTEIVPIARSINVCLGSEQSSTGIPCKPKVFKCSKHRKACSVAFAVLAAQPRSLTTRSASPLAGSDKPGQEARPYLNTTSNKSAQPNNRSIPPSPLAFTSKRSPRSTRRPSRVRNGVVASTACTTSRLARSPTALAPKTASTRGTCGSARSASRSALQRSDSEKRRRVPQSCPGNRTTHTD
mmetsp:Transcript_71290/g.206752  ORF Transcript_71290/g.206752 Transcript_71290/m.206752 type:complete len:207 (-) Transcript_71290:285-905(-)